jgi:hypothetical protein
LAFTTIFPAATFEDTPPFEEDDDELDELDGREELDELDELEELDELDEDELEPTPVSVQAVASRLITTKGRSFFMVFPLIFCRSWDVEATHVLGD